MLRIIPLVLGIAMSMTAPVLAQTTTTQTSPQGARLTCSQPMPGLDLGTRAKPTKEQAETWCSCIWETLSKADREFSEGLKTGESDMADTIKMDRFSNNIGSALEGCAK